MTTDTPNPALIRPFTQLTCPLDGEQLQFAEKTWRCSSGHCFDVAKQGYVNLLPVQNKRSKDPGDSKEMVQARARFLSQQFYQPLAKAINDAVFDKSPEILLDAGCGEGYYLRQLIQTAEHRQHPLSLVALDISKWAVLEAAKQEKRVSWLVASNNQIPIASNSIDTLLCIFGFPVAKEFNRVLKDNGRLVMVDPAPAHLTELKQIIYPELKAKQDQLLPALADWSLESEQRVTFTIELVNQASIHDLLTMTPHFYRASHDGRARAEALESLSLTVDVWIRCFKPQC